MTSAKQCYWVYITCPDKDEARKIGRYLLTHRLVACANIFDGIESMYWWQDEIASDQETVLVAKTQASLFDKLCAAVRSQHSYEVPCVVGLPIDAGLPPFLSWIGEETTPR